MRCPVLSQRIVLYACHAMSGGLNGVTCHEQSAVVLEAAGKPCGVKTACIYGGERRSPSCGMRRVVLRNAFGTVCGTEVRFWYAVWY